MTMAEAQEAAAHWGGAASLRLVRERENAVYEVVLGKERAALRLHRIGYQTRTAIRSELWWCTALADAGLPVPRPLPARDGALLKRLGSGRFASAVQWVDGRPIGEGGVPLVGGRAVLLSRFRAIGDLLARLHDATDRLVLPDWFDRPRWDLEGLVGDQPLWGRFWEHPALTRAERSLLLATRDHLRAALAHHRTSGGDFGLIHADVLRENLIMAPHGPQLIDFDDAGFGFRGYDLGTALSQSLSEPLFPELAAALVQGYAAHRATDRGMVLTWALARCCASVGWLIPRVPWHAPLHRTMIDRALLSARAVLQSA